MAHFVAAAEAAIDADPIAFALIPVWATRPTGRTFLSFPENEYPPNRILPLATELAEAPAAVVTVGSRRLPALAFGSNFFSFHCSKLACTVVRSLVRP